MKGGSGEGYRLLVFVESVVPDAPIAAPILGFRLSELPPLFIPAPPPPLGLESTRRLAGATIAFGVGREASFRAAVPLPPYVTLHLRLVDEADGRLVGSGALRIPTRGGGVGDGSAGADGADGADGGDGAGGYAGDADEVARFVECRLSRAPTAHAPSTRLTSAQRHAAEQRAALNAAAAAASSAALDPDAAGAHPSARTAPADVRPTRSGAAGAAGESALVRFRWRLVPDALRGLAPDWEAAAIAGVADARADGGGAGSEAEAEARIYRAEAAKVATAATATVTEAAMRDAAIERNAPTVHAHDGCAEPPGASISRAGRAPPARARAPLGAAAATSPSGADARAAPPPPPACEPLARALGCAGGGAPPMRGVIPGTLEVRRPTCGVGTASDGGARVAGSAERGWQSATGSDGARARGGHTVGAAHAGVGQPDAIMFVRAATQQPLRARWWADDETLAPTVGRTELAPPQPPALHFVAPPGSGGCGENGALPARRRAPHPLHAAWRADAPPRRVGEAPQPFAAAERAASAAEDGGVWLRAEPLNAAAGSAAPAGGTGNDGPDDGPDDGPAARPAWRPSGAEAARAAEARCAHAAPAAPPPYSRRPLLATSRAALAQLNLDLEYMASRDYAAQLMRAQILEANPQLYRAPRPRDEQRRGASDDEADGSACGASMPPSPRGGHGAGARGPRSPRRASPGRAAPRDALVDASPRAGARAGSGRALEPPSAGAPPPGASWARLFARPAPPSRCRS
ncbi:hypothetical protein KFE25_006570 [Diacronema lutheri]|uniref:Uncharacterized protein n=1 Tax=Diacronema lutheri TaxID=2081491 RepID=A0A8J5XG85_DIALT|nr:hypothetical protein KFE25_006570 [Diacronema lutheri]